MENNKYEHFKAILKGLSFEIKLIDTNETEEFKIIVINTENNKVIVYNFFNSIMEKEISNILRENIKKYPFSQVKRLLKDKPLMICECYNKGINNLKALDNKRSYFLFYGVVNDLSGYITFSDENTTFKDFCDNFGYNEDSRKAEEVYKKCLELEKKIRSLSLTEEQKTYLSEKARTEEEVYKKDVLNLFNLKED